MGRGPHIRNDLALRGGGREIKVYLDDRRKQAARAPLEEGASSQGGNTWPEKEGTNEYIELETRNLPDE